MEKTNIYLIGFMGCGKSTVARKLEKAYNRKLIEMDEEIERQQGMSIPDIFAQRGEAAFRDLETQFLRDLQNVKNVVVSCGGGVVLREENVELMKQNGKIVLLTAAPETIYERVKDSTNRPVLNGNMNVSYIEELMKKREPKYLAAADQIVPTDGKTIADICKEIAG